MDRSAHILVVDDDKEIRSLLSKFLAKNGLRVSVAADGREMRRVLDEAKIDLIVLDLMLPGDSGLTLCGQLRATTTIPILMLTAVAEETDRIIGLEMGADDYLPKPFNPRELVARINAVLRRRSAPLPPGAPSAEVESVEFGGMTVNLATRTLVRNGEHIALTTGEFALLKVLVTHPRVPLSRDKLMELARGREYEVFDRAIDVQVSRLRKLIESDPSSPTFIQTVWGFGYVFVPDGTKA